VKEGERKGWEEKRREGKKGERTGRDGRQGKNVLPHSKQAVAAYGNTVFWELCYC